MRNTKINNLVISLAFYKGPGNIITYLIRLFTWSKYSHAELIFSDGTCFSSTAKEPYNGVYLSLFIFRNPLYWDLIRLPEIDQKDEKEILKYCQFLETQEFSWKGLFSFIFPFIKKEYCKWYCSEAILYVLQKGSGLHKDISIKISPKNLFLLF